MKTSENGHVYKNRILQKFSEIRNMCQIILSYTIKGYLILFENNNLILGLSIARVLKVFSMK